MKKTIIGCSIGITSGIISGKTLPVVESNKAADEGGDKYSPPKHAVANEPILM